MMSLIAKARKNPLESRVITKMRYLGLILLIPLVVLLIAWEGDRARDFGESCRKVFIFGEDLFQALLTSWCVEAIVVAVDNMKIVLATRVDWLCSRCIWKASSIHKSSIVHKTSRVTCLLGLPIVPYLIAKRTKIPKCADCQSLLIFGYPLFHPLLLCDYTLHRFPLKPDIPRCPNTNLYQPLSVWLLSIDTYGRFSDHFEYLLIILA